MTETEQKRASPEGLWNALTAMEVGSTMKLLSQLAPFEQPLRACYEAGVQVPTLPGKRHREPDMLMAALFLKKALNDLRATWVLCQLGYTSQAAAVAASLFENALAATCIAGVSSNASTFRGNSTGDLPWTPIQLSKMLADLWRRDALAKGKTLTKIEYERMWRQVYVAYKWLCKIKHPTYQSAVHDAGATSLSKPEYVVMAAPDIREEDLPVKATILTTSISRCYEAIRRFAVALECNTEDTAYQEFSTRLAPVLPLAIEAMQKLATAPLPFDVSRTEFAREWVLLEKKAQKK